MDKECSHRFKIYIQNLAEGGALDELSWPRIWEAKRQHNHFLPTTGHNNFLEKITDSSQTAAVELKPFFPCSFPKKCPICFPQKDFQQLASHLNMKKKKCFVSGMRVISPFNHMIGLLPARLYL